MPQNHTELGLGDDGPGYLDLEPRGEEVGTSRFYPIRPGDTMFFPIGVVASRMGVPLEWLEHEADAKRIPYLEVGSCLLFNPYAVARALLHRGDLRQ